MFIVKKWTWFPFNSFWGVKQTNMKTIWHVHSRWTAKGASVNPFKPIFWKYEFEYEFLCGALQCCLEVLCQNWRKSIFQFFFFHCNLFFSQFKLEILCGVLHCYWKVVCKKMKRIYPWNSDLCKLFLQKRPETCGTQRSQQVWKD